MQMHRQPVGNRAPRNRGAIVRPSFPIHRYRAMMCAEKQVSAVLQDNDGIISFAKLAGGLDNGLQDRPDIGR